MYVPAIHEKHEVAAVAKPYEPAGQEEQAAEPVVALYVPAGHAVQDVPEYPILHRLHVADPASLYKFVAHVEQVLEPAELYCLTEHLLQLATEPAFTVAP